MGAIRNLPILYLKFGGGELAAFVDVKNGCRLSCTTFRARFLGLCRCVLESV